MTTTTVPTKAESAMSNKSMPAERPKAVTNAHRKVKVVEVMEVGEAVKSL
jgi:hypothetical protein